jgi:hypothetical protein
VSIRRIVFANASTAPNGRSRWLAQCDIFIAEVSGSSFDLGFETGYLLGATPKKTILFYERAVGRKISLLIVGNTDPKCILVLYSRLDEREELVRTCVSSREIP